jgi:hypothetical protein
MKNINKLFFDESLNESKLSTLDPRKVIVHSHFEFARREKEIKLSPQEGLALFKKVKLATNLLSSLKIINYSVIIALYPKTRKLSFTLDSTISHRSTCDFLPFSPHGDPEEEQKHFIFEASPQHLNPHNHQESEEEHTFQNLVIEDYESLEEEKKEENSNERIEKNNKSEEEEEGYSREEKSFLYSGMNEMKRSKVEKRLHLKLSRINNSESMGNKQYHKLERDERRNVKNLYNYSGFCGNWNYVIFISNFLQIKNFYQYYRMYKNSSIPAQKTQQILYSLLPFENQ